MGASVSSNEPTEPPPLLDPVSWKSRENMSEDDKIVQQEQIRKALSTFTPGGPIYMRLFGAGCCAAGIAETVLRWLAGSTNKGDFMADGYLIFFCLVGLLLEFPHFNATFFFSLEYWIKCLSRAWGKGIFYLILSGYESRHWNFLGRIIGACMLALGLLYLLFSKFAAMKMSNIRQNFKSYLDGSWSAATVAFDTADENRDGKLSLIEYQKVSEELGAPMTLPEVYIFMNFMDKDKDGFVSRKEFKAWYYQKHLPTWL